MNANVGDMVWVAEWERTRKWIPCPDCFGKKALTVILGDESKVTIDCAGCSAGYEPPRGVIETHTDGPRTKQVTVTRVETELRDGKQVTTYQAGCRIYHQVYGDEATARAASEILCIEHQNEETLRLSTKDKPTRTWAWHVTYHRRCIKDAEKNLEYHRAKLVVAREKAKEPETAQPT